MPEAAAPSTTGRCRHHGENRDQTGGRQSGHRRSSSCPPAAAAVDTSPAKSVSSARLRLTGDRFLPWNPVLMPLRLVLAVLALSLVAVRPLAAELQPHRAIYRMSLAPPEQTSDVAVCRRHHALPVRPQLRRLDGGEQDGAPARLRRRRGDADGVVVRQLGNPSTAATSAFAPAMSRTDRNWRSWPARPISATTEKTARRSSTNRRPCVSRCRPGHCSRPPTCAR